MDNVTDGNGVRAGAGYIKPSLDGTFSCESNGVNRRTVVVSRHTDFQVNIF